MGKGIKELHSLEFIHRDLKPENIVLNLKPLEVRIIDFDRSKNMLSTKTGVDRGTPGYYPGGCRWKDGNPMWDIWAYVAIVCEVDMSKDSYFKIGRNS